MVRFLFIIIFCVNSICCVGIVPEHRLDTKMQVKIGSGVIQGSLEKSLNGLSYFNFVGIPYARPPVGNLRFRDPKPMPKWSGVLDATVEGPCCAGLNLSAISNLEFKVQGAEDCLYLNVYTPKIPTENLSKQPLAVIVYIYGGGFFGGCSSKTDYGPDFFMENNVVLVTFNHRISVFGYLSTEDLECPGNWATKDQIAVLKWLQINIRKFDGDPNRVTIAGQSAGATSVNVLVLSPKANGLFHGAILQSGSTLSFWAYQTEQRKVAFDVGLALGIETNSTKELINELRKVSSDVLAQGQISAIIVNLISIITNGLPFTPSIEPVHKEAVLTDYSYNMLEKGNFNKVPILTGVTTLETLLFKRAIEVAKPLLVLFELSPGSFVRMTKSIQNRTIVGNKVKSYFLPSKSFPDSTEEEIMKLLSDEAYWRPMHKMSNFLAKHTSLYFYSFSYEGELGLKSNLMYNGISKRDIKGVAHSEDVYYLFNNKFNANEDDRHMSKKFTKLFTNFAKTGNPTPVKDILLNNITWPIVTEKSFPFVDIGQNLQVVKENFNEESFQFWETLFRMFADKPYKVY